jgi:hypothetical protein
LTKRGDGARSPWELEVIALRINAFCTAANLSVPQVVIINYLIQSIFTMTQY